MQEHEILHPRHGQAKQQQADDEEQVDPKQPNTAPAVHPGIQHTQAVAGHDVVFPHIPYGAQNAFMYKLIHALQNKQNALLEAPTGAGKTLCLLCGALAWQSRLKKEFLQATLASMGGGSGKSESLTDRPADTIMDVDGIPIELDMLHREAEGEGPGSPEAEGAKRIKVPQIYYATRTHSQIDQVVKELKRTAYKPSMAILAARRFYCINSAVIKSGKIDEECEELNREEFGCRFHRQKGSKITGLQVHDIEDLVKHGKKQKACPYYASREMMVTAELVFCPYNYLVDPSIREALGLNLSNAVVIFDEAHNIEDMAREAGSIDVQLSVLLDVHQALLRAKTFSSKPEPYEVLFKGVENLMCWLKEMSESDAMKATDSHGREQCKQAVFHTPQQIFQHLEAAQLTAEAVRLLHKAYKSAREYENSKDATFANNGEAAEQPVPQDMKTAGAGAAALGVLSQLLTVLQMLYGTLGMATPAVDIAAEQGAAEGEAGQAPVQAPAAAADHGAEYRMVVTSVTQTAPISASQRKGKRGRQVAVEAIEGPTQTNNTTVTLGLWCMTPSVAFHSLASCCHSLVLTSGTLSPLTSFASELGTAFDVKLEGKHVVDMSKQVWASVLASGPAGCEIRTTFQNKDNTRMQDDVGQVLLQLAETVPSGMLVFFPSYTTMDQLVRHWKSSGLWQQLSTVKDCVVEPREGGTDFEKAMAQHKATIARGRGSLLMAVCRGKVSEGIDFKDDQARAVVIIGIPYPAARDTKVMLKKGYNDKQRTTVGPQATGGMSSGSNPAQVLTGEQWYELQAFRALNQAVGRCIRHKYDYGAVILLDARFKESRYINKLPAWVRGSVQVAPSFGTAKKSLQSFFANLQANPPAAAMVRPAPTDTAPAGTAAAAGATGYGGHGTASYPQSQWQLASSNLAGQEGSMPVAVAGQPPSGGAHWHANAAAADALTAPQLQGAHQAGSGPAAGTYWGTSLAVQASGGRSQHTTLAWNIGQQHQAQHAAINPWARVRHDHQAAGNAKAIETAGAAPWPDSQQQGGSWAIPTCSDLSWNGAPAGCPQQHLSTQTQQQQQQQQPQLHSHQPAHIAATQQQQTQLYMHLSAHQPSPPPQQQQQQQQQAQTGPLPPQQTHALQSPQAIIPAQQQHLQPHAHPRQALQSAGHGFAFQTPLTSSPAMGAGAGCVPPAPHLSPGLPASLQIADIPPDGEETAWLATQAALAAPSVNRAWQSFAQVGDGMMQPNHVPTRQQQWGQQQSHSQAWWQAGAGQQTAQQPVQQAPCLIVGAQEAAQHGWHSNQAVHVAAAQAERSHNAHRWHQQPSTPTPMHGWAPSGHNPSLHQQPVQQQQVCTQQQSYTPLPLATTQPHPQQQQLPSSWAQNGNAASTPQGAWEPQNSPGSLGSHAHDQCHPHEPATMGPRHAAGALRQGYGPAMQERTHSMAAEQGQGQQQQHTPGPTTQQQHYPIASSSVQHHQQQHQQQQVPPSCSAPTVAQQHMLHSDKELHYNPSLRGITGQYSSYQSAGHASWRQDGWQHSTNTFGQLTSPALSRDISAQNSFHKLEGFAGQVSTTAAGGMQPVLGDTTNTSTQAQAAAGSMTPPCGMGMQVWQGSLSAQQGSGGQKRPSPVSTSSSPAGKPAPKRVPIYSCLHPDKGM